MLHFFKNKRKERSVFKIFTFYNSQINPEIPKHQKLVFDKFGISINQIKDDGTNHAGFLNEICKNTIDTDYLIFFDIDCIPTKKEWIVHLLTELLENKETIVGAAQTANHIGDAKNLYISPFFVGISTDFLKKLNYPDATANSKMDVWQNITEQAKLHNGNLKYWWPTDIEEEKWYLHHPVHNKFGIGTTYNDLIYHAFFSRENNSDGFINKCKSILGQ